MRDHTHGKFPEKKKLATGLEIGLGHTESFGNRKETWLR
jgi:hypothetical protein